MSDLKKNLLPVLLGFLVLGLMVVGLAAQGRGIPLPAQRGEGSPCWRQDDQACSGDPADPDCECREPR